MTDIQYELLFMTLKKTRFIRWRTKKTKKRIPYSYNKDAYSRP